MTTTRISLKDLNANEVFTMSEEPTATKYVCQSRHHEAGVGTRIVYTILGDHYPWTFTKPGLTDVYLVA
jgi:hypothetical protein